MSIYHGGCHCGAVRFEIEAAESVVVQECNCSICAMSGFLHLIVPAAHFRLLSGADRLSTYTFGTATARHLFCATCGIKSFYVPRSNPDGYSVNLRCLDDAALLDARIEAFDGQHWEAHGAALAGLSKDTK